MLLLALASCRKDVEPSPSLTTTATSLPTSAAPSASASPSPSAELADAYRGTISPDLPIVMRLQATHATVLGSYFYEKTGGSLRLSGSFIAGELGLEESDGRREHPTGSFLGKLSPSGEVSGIWRSTKGGTERRFTLTPIARRAGMGAVVVERLLRSRTKMKAGASRSVDILYPELYGLADARVEGTVNRLFAPNEKDEPCADQVGTVTGSFAVHLNRDGLFSVTLAEGYYCGGPYPAAGGASFNVRLDTGAQISLDELFAKGGKEKLPALVEPLVAERIAKAGASASDAEMVQTAYLSGSFVLEDAGLRLIAFYALPHAFQGIDPEPGIVIPWVKLKSLLNPASPAALAWKDRTGP